VSNACTSKISSSLLYIPAEAKKKQKHKNKNKNKKTRTRIPDRHVVPYQVSLVKPQLTHDPFQGILTTFLSIILEGGGRGQRGRSET
jgi:hypothetical protein